MNVRHDDPRLSWHGHVSLECTAEWTMPWRINHHERALHPWLTMVDCAAMASGVRLAFRSDATSVALRVEPLAGDGRVDLAIDGSLVGTRDGVGADELRWDGLPGREKLLELWLPPGGQLRLRGLELSVGASLAPYQDARKRWITYGSSITHCGGASSPIQTWPAIVARELDLNLTNLGYGGNCHLDPMIALTIRDLPADYLSMCVGINIYGHGSLNARTFRPAIIGFVQLVREKHPDTPFAIASPIISPPRETTPNKVEFTLEAMRAEVADAVEALRSCGDRHVHYVDGLDLFGADLLHLLPDQVHPDADGYKALAANFLRHVAHPLFT